jgi:hypothetical protein
VTKHDLNLNYLMTRYDLDLITNVVSSLFRKT